MCGSAAQFLGTGDSGDRDRCFSPLLDDDPRPRPDPFQQPAQAWRLQRDAAGGWLKPLARHVNEDRAAAAGNARTGVMVKLDDQVIEAIVPPQSVGCRTLRDPNRPVIETIPGIFAPAVVLSDRPDGQERARAWRAVPPPPQADQ